jgi:hypothetical protein
MFIFLTIWNILTKINLKLFKIQMDCRLRVFIYMFIYVYIYTHIVGLGYNVTKELNILCRYKRVLL